VAYLGNLLEPTISAGAGWFGLDRIDILASSSASGIWIGSDVSPPVFGERMGRRRY
jgi:hypothetical protein